MASELIGIAGTGRMAKGLGAALVRAGVPVAVVAGRRREAAVEAAGFVGAAQGVSLDELPRFSRRILIAVSDDAITDVASVLCNAQLTSAIVLHTSGAAGPDALESLRQAGCSIGVLHPLQTVPDAARGAVALTGATFGYAGDERACEWAKTLIDQLGGRVLAVDAAKWHAYHAAAVMACNYCVTLVDAALEMMEMAGLARTQALEALAPLIRATAENVVAAGPEAALTGPIRRGDVGTVRNHLAALAEATAETRELYRAAGLRTVAVARRAGLSAESCEKVAEAFHE